jgi:hypothetical protein
MNVIIVHLNVVFLHCTYYKYLRDVLQNPASSAQWHHISLNHAFV